jgi:hypothetical protein
VDDKCEECFELWQESLRHMDWEELCTKNSKDKLTTSLVKGIREVKTGIVAKNFPGAEVLTSDSMEIEVSRSFTCMSEKEMRSASNSKRISKLALKNLPTLRTQAEDGSGEEVLYCFKDESKPFRTAKVKVTIGNSLQKYKMQQDTQYWSGQGAETLTMANNSLCVASGLGGLLDKDTGNHLYSWEEFVEKKLVVEKKGGSSGGDGLGVPAGCIDLEVPGDDDGGGSENDEDEELVGAAASVAGGAASNSGMRPLAKALFTASRAASRTPSASPRASRMEGGGCGSSPVGDLPLDGHTGDDSQAASQGGFTYAESQVLDAGDFEGQPCTSVCVHTHPLMLLGTCHGLYISLV